METFIENILETQDDHNEHLTIKGIVVNWFQSQAELPKEVIPQLRGEGLPVINSMLLTSVMMKESHYKNLPPIHMNLEHKLTQAYQLLFNEIES